MADRHQPLSLTLVSPEDQAPTPPPTPEGVWLRLEQAPLEGVASGMSFADWFSVTYPGRQQASFAEMMRYYEEWRSFCNKKAEFLTEIWVHKSHPDLPYRLDATRGRWQHASPIVETDEKTQTFAIRGEASQQLFGEAVVGVVCAQWEGNVYNEFGEQIIPRPRISLIRPDGVMGTPYRSYDDQSTIYVPSVSDSTLVFPDNPLTGERVKREVTLPNGTTYTVYMPSGYTRDLTVASLSGTAVSAALYQNIWTLVWGQKVTGTLRVVYAVEYDVWSLAISARTVTGDSVGNYDGSGSSIEDYDDSGYGVAICTEAYDDRQPGTVYAATVYGVYSGGVETLEIETPPLEGNCGGGGGDDDDDDDEEPECYKLTIKYHKCTGEKISEDLIRVPCPDE